MYTDSVADCLTRVRNAQRAGHRSASVRCSTLGQRVLEVLLSEGFIGSFEKKQANDSKFPHFEVVLKYYAPGEPLIRKLVRVSKPGRRVYRRFSQIQRVSSGLGITVLSTSAGVMSDREARRRKIGGEILATVS